MNSNPKIVMINCETNSDPNTFFNFMDAPVTVIPTINARMIGSNFIINPMIRMAKKEKQVVQNIILSSLSDASLNTVSTINAPK